MTDEEIKQVRGNAALRADTSSKVTAPLRGVSSGLPAKKGNQARWLRLQKLAELGEGPAGKKAPARIAVYGFGRLVARSSVGRATAGLVRVVLPRPYQWLYTRYAIYRSAVTPEMETRDLSAEEEIMLLRLLARDRSK